MSSGSTIWGQKINKLIQTAFINDTDISSECKRFLLKQDDPRTEQKVWY